MGAGLSLQRAVWQALTTAPAVAGGRVYDFVPERADYPFVSVDSVDATDASGSGVEHREVNLTLNVWSQAPGWLEADDVADAIAARLHRAALGQVTGWRAVLMFERDRTHLRDPDGKTRRVILRFRAYSEAV